MPTILHRLNAWAAAAPEAPAQRFQSGGRWHSISAREFRDRVYHLGLFLESRGLGPEGCGVILSYNCPEWVQLDLATLLVGARSAGIYPNSTPRDIRYILNHTEASVLAVQNREYYAKIADGNPGPALPDHIRLLLVFDGDTSIAPGAVAFSDAVAEGRRRAESGRAPPLADYLGRVEPHAGVIMIYTSGTTGTPKGALLSHDNLVFASDAIAERWRLPPGPGDLFSFLPLCHIAEKVQNVGVGISRRYAVNFCSRFENLSLELKQVQPTLLLCVPRLWEKMKEGVLRAVSRSRGIKGRLARWALEVGARVAEARYSGQRPTRFDRIRLGVADRLVLSRMRRELGLARAELLASGAAALPANVSRWFRALGLEILEDFGQTETTGILCMTDPGTDSAGTVGRPISGVEFLIAEDGEILTRGRHVFRGYFKDPDATALALTPDGWLHTGDLGAWDSRGLVKILGRKKEILKTSGGKMVAPHPIEERLKESPLIGQACMVGDGRKFLSVLISPSEGVLAELRAGSPGSLEREVVSHPETLAEIRMAVDQLNRSLAQYEQIKRFVVISREFSIAEGEMTPTLKMKRSVIEARFRGLIDSMYADSDG